MLPRSSPMTSDVEHQLDDEATSFLRGAVENGVSVQMLLDGQAGSHGNGISCQIGNYFSIGREKPLLKMKRGQMAVRIGSDYKVYMVHEVYAKCMRRSCWNGRNR